MDTIIVTVRDRAGTLCCDMELPTNQPAALLMEEMARVLADYEPGFTASITGLMNPRTDRRIPDHATLEMAGVWNGDYLVIDTEASA